MHRRSPTESCTHPSNISTSTSTPILLTCPGQTLSTSRSFCSQLQTRARIMSNEMEVDLPEISPVSTSAAPKLDKGKSTAATTLNTLALDALPWVEKYRPVSLGKCSSTRLFAHKLSGADVIYWSMMRYYRRCCSAW